ncbi:hypothetical protein FB45DRAFT_321083 [Roridomyces roridus]|uniref:Uncharacterized protein n=1 Tax=Roridomyces roridus TaxID=1738132 RepID=A0AAD7FC43_9AGAR|nr:hypothetical protein FB45DRAFT_321083 [Roridomyces roridus]
MLSLIFFDGSVDVGASACYGAQRGWNDHDLARRTLTMTRKEMPCESFSFVPPSTTGEFWLREHPRCRLHGPVCTSSSSSSCALLPLLSPSFLTLAPWLWRKGRCPSFSSSSWRTHGRSIGRARRQGLQRGHSLHPFLSTPCQDAWRSTIPLSGPAANLLETGRGYEVVGDSRLRDVNDCLEPEDASSGVSCGPCARSGDRRRGEMRLAELCGSMLVKHLKDVEADVGPGHLG